VGACGGNVLWMEAGKRECNRIDSASGVAETTLESQRRGCQTVDSPPMDRLKSDLQGGGRWEGFLSPRGRKQWLVRHPFPGPHYLTRC